MPYVQLPGTKFVIPKDDIAKNYTKVVQFLEEIKLYLVIEEAVMHLKLTVDQKDLVKKYLGVVELLLTETDALVRENLLRKLTL
jgi:hypothetical protein